MKHPIDAPGCSIITTHKMDQKCSNPFSISPQLSHQYISLAFISFPQRGTSIHFRFLFILFSSCTVSHRKQPCGFSLHFLYGVRLLHFIVRILMPFPCYKQVRLVSVARDNDLYNKSVLTIKKLLEEPCLKMYKEKK